MDQQWNPGYPVHIYQEGMELPKEGTYFVVSGNGLWMHKDTGICSGFVPVDNISFLNDLKAQAEVRVNLPKFPARHVWRIKEFFRRVVEAHSSEAGTVLYFNKNTGEFRVHVPQQSVSHGGVRYKRVGTTHLEDMEDFLRVGTIHSHCDFGAFHSSTDVDDEEDFDGLHVTFGHNNRDNFTISASIVMNGFRTKVDPLDVLEGIEAVEGEKETYLLRGIDDATKQEWSKDLDQWMSQVKSCSNPFSFRRLFSDFCSGDMVTWQDGVAESLKQSCGDGPFEVLFVIDEKITIRTKAGTARFSQSLFRKA